MGTSSQSSKINIDNPMASQLDASEKSESQKDQDKKVDESEINENDDDEGQQESEDESKTEEKSVHLLVENMPMRSRFLTKIGILFSLYFFFLFSACIFSVYQVELSRQVYRRLHLASLIWLILSLIFILKFTCGFFGEKIKKFLGIAYIIDTILSVIFVVALYFWVDSNLANRFTNNAPKVFIYVSMLLASSVVFTLTTLLHSQRNTFSVFISLSFQLIINGGLLFMFFEFWSTYITISLPQFIGIFAIVAILNIYLSLNSYMVVRFRTKMYYDNESFRCYYKYWVDWFSFFWIDGFRSSRKLRKIIRQRRQKNKLKRDIEVGAKKKLKTGAIQKWSGARKKAIGQASKGGVNA